MGVRKILIIRSARMRQTGRAIRHLSYKYPKAEISILAQNKVMLNLAWNPKIKKIYLYKHPTFNIFHFDTNLLHHLRKEKFDLCLILYNNPRGKGYFHVNLIAYLISAKRYFIIDVENNFYEISSFRLLPLYYLGYYLGRIVDFLLYYLGRIVDYIIFLIVVSILYIKINIREFCWKSKRNLNCSDLNLQKKLKICFIADGGSVHVHKWMDFFRNKGHEIYLITNRPTGYNGVKEYCFDISINLGIDFTQKYFKIKKLIKLINPDILHSHYVQYYGFWSALTDFHPQVLTVWGGDVLFEQEAIARGCDPEKFCLPWWRAFLTKLSLRNSDIVTADSVDAMDRAVFLGAKKVRTELFVWGVDVERFNDRIYSDIRRDLNLNSNPVVISMRNFISYYNVDKIIEAIPIVLKEIPDTKFIFLGDGPQKDVLIDLIKKLKIKRAVRWVGKVSYNDVPRYLSVADIFVSVPSSDATSMSLLEAMSCGLPIIATDIPANREWVRDKENGILIPPKSSEAIAFAIIELLKDNKRMKEFGRASQEVIKNKANFHILMEEILIKYYTLSQIFTK